MKEDYLDFLLVLFAETRKIMKNDMLNDSPETKRPVKVHKQEKLKLRYGSN